MLIWIRHKIRFMVRNRFAAASIGI